MRELIPAENPWGNLTRPFRRGDNAWPVVALQRNLNAFGNALELDGVFGPATERVVKAFQRHRGLEPDGIAGPVTQEWVVRSLLRDPERRYSLPRDLMRGIAQGESDFMLACYSAHPSGAGFDLGALQDSFDSPTSQARYLDALDVEQQAVELAAKLRRQHDLYVARGADGRLAWECAALYHNRPVSADRMAKGLAASTTTGPVEWVEVASGGRLHTIQEWCESYISKATRYAVW